MSRLIRSFRPAFQRALGVLAVMFVVTVGSQPAAAQCAATWLASPSDQPGVGGGAVHAHVVMPNGDIVVGGDFTSAGGVTAQYIARWDGTRWSALGSGLNGPVRSLAVLPNGDLIVGGAFSTAGG